MAWTIDEIGAAIPARLPLRVWPARGGIKSKMLPQPDTAPDDRSEPNLVSFGGCGYRRKTAKVGLYVEKVFGLHGRIGCVGKGRNVIRVLWGNSPHGGIEEIEVRPAADAGARIGRKVGRVENANRGLEMRSARGQF